MRASQLNAPLIDKARGCSRLGLGLGGSLLRLALVADGFGTQSRLFLWPERLVKPGNNWDASTYYAAGGFWCWRGCRPSRSRLRSCLWWGAWTVHGGAGQETYGVERLTRRAKDLCAPRVHTVHLFFFSFLSCFLYC